MEETQNCLKLYGIRKTTVDELVKEGKYTDNIEVYSAVMRGIFLSMLHKHEIGEEVFEDALRLMIRGVVMQMFEEGLK